MVESEDKGLPLMRPTFFDDKDPSNPKYVSDFDRYINNFIELVKTNPEEAKKQARKALYETGVIDENGNLRKIVNDPHIEGRRKKLKKY